MRPAAGWLFALLISPAACATPLDFSDFSAPWLFRLSGSATYVDPHTLRLTPAAESQSGGVWLADKIDLSLGLDVVFRFRISNLGGWPVDWSTPPSPGADGLAFVVQNYQPAPVGTPNSGIGYMGIPSSISVEFDTWRNKPETSAQALLYCDEGQPAPQGLEVYCEPDANHISVHSLGEHPNRPEHRPVEVETGVYQNPDLGTVTTGIPMEDGQIHMARITYGSDVLAVYLDDLTTPKLSVFVSVPALIGAPDNEAWIGVVAATGGAWAFHDLVQAEVIPIPEASTAVAVALGLCLLALRRER